MNSLRLPHRQCPASSHPATFLPALPFQKRSSHASTRSSSGRKPCTAARSLLQDLSPAPSARDLDLLLSTTTRDPLEREIGWRTTFAEDYDICSQIGAGAFGQVYLAQHRMSGQQFAVKMMPKVRGKQSRASSVRALHREAQLQRLVQCPGVAALVDCYEDANSVQLVTELCRGGDLKQHVELHGALDEASLAAVAHQVLLVLRACHHQSILFADCKPANFCLPSPAHSAALGPRSLRAIDFGCSQRLGPSLRSSKRSGTLAFMAPETFDRDFGFKADVWGLGVSLYWLCALRLPYWSLAETPRAPSLEDMVAAVQGGGEIPFDYGPWLQLSAEAVDFVRGCLQRREGERLGVEEALAHPWIKRMQG